MFCTVWCFPTNAVYMHVSFMRQPSLMTTQQTFILVLIGKKIVNIRWEFSFSNFNDVDGRYWWMILQQGTEIKITIFCHLHRNIETLLTCCCSNQILYLYLYICNIFNICMNILGCVKKGQFSLYLKLILPNHVIFFLLIVTFLDIFSLSLFPT